MTGGFVLYDFTRENLDYRKVQWAVHTYICGARSRPVSMVCALYKQKLSKAHIFKANLQ